MDIQVERRPGVTSLKVITTAEYDGEQTPTTVRVVRWLKHDYVLFYDAVFHTQGIETVCKYRPDETCTPIDAQPARASCYSEIWKLAQTILGFEPITLIVQLLASVGATMNQHDHLLLLEQYAKFMADPVNPK